MNDEYLTPIKTSELLKVTTRTLQNWDLDGKLKCFRTEGGHRRFLLSDIRKLMHPNEVVRRKIAYCRVSKASQKEELQKQIEFLKARNPAHEIIYDIGSGLNFKRKEFQAILDSAIKGDIAEIVVTHKDRLCRFGFELFERIVNSTNGKIVVLDQGETSPDKELVDDLISIVSVFSSRVAGLRDRSLRRQIKRANENTKDTASPEPKGESDPERDDGEVSVVL